MNLKCEKCGGNLAFSCWGDVGSAWCMIDEINNYVIGLNKKTIDCGFKAYIGRTGSSEFKFITQEEYRKRL